MIQSIGFSNVADSSGAITGFTFSLRMPNYRGVWASLIDGVDVMVDGNLHWDRETPMWELQGRTSSLEELRNSSRLRWQLDELAKIIVPHPGGLPAGVHLLSVRVSIFAPYIPIEFQPSVFEAERKVTLV